MSDLDCGWNVLVETCWLVDEREWTLAITTRSLYKLRF
jgi:hypothetical protein